MTISGPKRQQLIQFAIRRDLTNFIIVSQLVMKFSAFYGTRRIIAVFTIVREPKLHKPEIFSMPPIPLKCIQ
jgi:hypothetical protein